MISRIYRNLALLGLSMAGQAFAYGVSVSASLPTTLELSGSELLTSYRVIMLPQQAPFYGRSIANRSSVDMAISNRYFRLAGNSTFSLAPAALLKSNMHLESWYARQNEHLGGFSAHLDAEVNIPLGSFALATGFTPIHAFEYFQWQEQPRLLGWYFTTEGKYRLARNRSLEWSTAWNHPFAINDSTTQYSVLHSWRFNVPSLETTEDDTPITWQPAAGMTWRTAQGLGLSGRVGVSGEGLPVPRWGKNTTEETEEEDTPLWAWQANLGSTLFFSGQAQFKANVSVLDLIGAGSTLEAYAAYQPIPYNTPLTNKEGKALIKESPVRFGLLASMPIGEGLEKKGTFTNGLLHLHLAGGKNYKNETGWNIGAKYSVRF